MKRAWIILAMALALLASAHAEVITGQHLTLLGIPIDGSIDSFTHSLSTKGIELSGKHDYDTHNEWEYDGEFLGYPAFFIVNSTLNDGSIYNCSAFVDAGSYDQAIEICTEIRRAIINSYENSIIEDDEPSDDALTLSVYNRDNERVGSVDIILFNNNDSTYTIYILFYDEINFQKYS